MASVMQAVSDGFEGVRDVLFRPFDLGQWFVLGFSAFLAMLGEGGGPNFQMPGGQGPGGGIGRPSDAAAWIEANLLTILVAGAAILLFGLAIMALLSWLSSRGKFMFLDCVVTRNAAVTEPWRRYRALANNLFAFRFALTCAMTALSLALLAVAALLAWPDLRADRFGAGAIAAIALAGGFILTIVVAYGVFKSVVEDFLLPIMYARNIRALEALAVFRAEVMPGFVGPLVLFYLMKFLLGFCAGMAMVMVMCLSCCIAAIPYISSVVFLPVSVFFRCYSLSFLEQIDPQWRLTPSVSEIFE